MVAENPLTIPDRTSPARTQATRWLNLALLLLIASALMAGVWITYQTIEAEREVRERAELNNDILRELRNIYQAALEAETGQHGYLVTLDRRYLEPYRAGREKIRPAIDNLRQLLPDDANAEQFELVDKIDRLATRKLADLDGVVTLLDQRELLDARRRVLTDDGQELMAELKATISEMESNKQQLLDQSAEAAAQAQARTIPLLGLLVFLVLVFVTFGARLVSRTARAETEAAQAHALAAAHDRADLLARELNHRVKNLFAVILAIIQMSGRSNPDAKPLIESISERVRALLTAHEVTQGAPAGSAASLKDLVETTLSPYRSASQPATIRGEALELPAQSITPLGLVLHEMTTNAVKYGAWAQSGEVDVSWTASDGEIVIEWRETGCSNDTEPERRGFGSQLMDSAARQLSGSIEREILAEGCLIRIAFPHPQLAAGS